MSETNLGKDEIGAGLRRAAADQRASEAREALCDSLANAFNAGGEMLWVSGSIIGPDRISGDSPFRHGNDAVVGLATVLQIAGELTEGACQLLRTDNLYAAATLIRQTVEVEYLAWAFSEAEDEATTWLRSSRQERLKLWQPKHLRERANGRFRAPDYWEHCEKGGHPTPRAVQLLRSHSVREPLGFWWGDLVGHASNIWGYSKSAAERLGVRDTMLANVDTDQIERLNREWELADPLSRVVRQRRSGTDDVWHRMLDAARAADEDRQ